MDDLHITKALTIPAAELSESFARSGGPGGQNVNKVASKVVLRWSIAETAALAERDRQWLLQRLGSRLTTNGELLVTASSTRDQVANREDARRRLAEIVRRALIRPKRRRPTKPSKGSIRRRLESKRQRSRTKALRKRPGSDD